jgi:HPr kinase/phosphorylase
MSNEFQNEHPELTIAEFAEKAPAELELKILAGAGGLAANVIDSERIQKLGLALAGFSHYIHPGRVQIVGQSEIAFLEQLSGEKKLEAFAQLDFEKISCILTTKNLSPPPELIEIADARRLPILQTPLVSSKTIGIVTNYLQERLAPQITVHGVLLEIYGVGVLILGESGIGKSECALDLITRGHRLISDDAVCIKKIGNRLEGRSPDLIREHIEIRGLGILNVRELFGVTSIGKCKQIELCIELVKWSDAGEVERVGLEMREQDVFGVKIPKVVLPVSSGRNLSTLVETAVRVHLLRIAGYDAAQRLIEKHAAKIAGIE